ncbi:MAG: aldehyde dehydrogenase family protein [Gammaproteobacteria bacterium]|nr:aldehyde dehydrogenase family protein [Gammaproteobacteria bacterium]
MADNEGAVRLCGGERIERPRHGLICHVYLLPAVYANCDNEMKHVREEFLGPVVMGGVNKVVMQPNFIQTPRRPARSRNNQDTCSGVTLK